MALIVQKFGGSSVADLAKIQNVARRVARTVEAGNQVVVVLSAMGDTTDDLIAMARQITPYPSEREMDMLMTTGEQQSVAFLAITLQAMGYKAVSLTGEQAGIRTDRVYSRAKILSIDSVRLERELAAGKIVIVTGFQGVDSLGEIHTLGRGGSDTSGVALAIGLNADFCEIYTDVDGVYTADPRIVPDAHKLSEISFDEMLEMSSLGAGVLQPRSVEMAKTFNMPICVRSSFNDNEGTMVKEEVEMKQLEQEVLVSGVAYDDDVIKVTVFGVPDVPGTASVLFGTLADAKINVDMIIQSGQKDNKNDISFTCGKEADGKLAEIMEPIVNQLQAERYTLEEELAKVSIVGAGMISNPGVAAKMFKCLYENGFNIDMISTSEIKTSCILQKEGAKEAVRKLHEYFGL